MSNASPNANNHFSADDLEKILANTFIHHIDYLKTIDSTNNRALELARESGDKFPLLVLASSQTAGRGRGTNTWWSKSGSLTFSVLLATDRAQLPTERWPQVSLTVGLAVCEAIEESLARGVPTMSLDTLPQVQLKWPNDVYVAGRKICGILVEVPRDRAGRLLIGIGINVNNSVAEAPEEIQNLATSLSDLTGKQHGLAEVLTQVLNQLANKLQHPDFWNDQIRAGWRQRCYLTGKKIQVDLNVRQATGTCHGINEEGALLVEVDGKIEPQLAGAVTILAES